VTRHAAPESEAEDVTLSFVVVEVCDVVRRREPYVLATGVHDLVVNGWDAYKRLDVFLYFSNAAL
jgi:hypothetical protein